MKDLYTMQQNIEKNSQMEEVKEDYRKSNVKRAYGGLAHLVLNYVAPVAGVLPSSWQHKLKDQYRLFSQLDPRAAVSASAIILGGFGIVGLEDLLQGDILREGVMLTYPFPQKVFGGEIIRQLPILEMSKETAKYVFGYLCVDSAVRLYYALIKNKPMGVFGPVKELISGTASIFSDKKKKKMEVSDVLREQDEHEHYEKAFEEQRNLNRKRGSSSFPKVES